METKIEVSHTMPPLLDAEGPPKSVDRGWN